MHRPFLFLSVLTSESNAAETASGINRGRPTDAATARPVALTTRDGSTATVRIQAFDAEGMKVSYDDGRVRQVSYDAIDAIECPDTDGGIRVIAVGGELAILAKSAAQGTQAKVH